MREISSHSGIRMILFTFFCFTRLAPTVNALAKFHGSSRRARPNRFWYPSVRRYIVVHLASVARRGEGSPTSNHPLPRKGTDAHWCCCVLFFPFQKDSSSKPCQSAQYPARHVTPVENKEAKRKPAWLEFMATRWKRPSCYWSGVRMLPRLTHVRSCSV